MRAEPLRFEFRRPDLAANLFVPRGRGPFPAIVMLAGSGGGVPERWPKALAEEGFVVLGLGYFKVEGLPDRLVGIPLEYLQSAINEFRRRSEVDEANLQLVGLSRGAELALLLATRDAAIRGVVSVSGSGLVHGTPDGAHMAPVWTEDGASLPYLEENNRFDDPTLPMSPDGRSVSPRARYLRNLKDDRAVERAVIPLERLRSPALLISGGDDHCWPAAALMAPALERMVQAGNRELATHLVFQDAGHVISGPFHTHSPADCYYELDGVTYFHGGTPEANAAASKQSWLSILDFLGR